MIFVQIWYSRGVGATWKQIGDRRLNCSAPIRTRPRHQSECVGATTYSPAMLGFCGAGLTWSFISAAERRIFYVYTHLFCWAAYANVYINIFFRLLFPTQIMPRKAQGRTTFDWNFCCVLVGCLHWTTNLMQLYILDMKLGAGESYWKFALPSYQSISRRVNAG